MKVYRLPGKPAAQDISYPSGPRAIHKSSQCPQLRLLLLNYDPNFEKLLLACPYVHVSHLFLPSLTFE